MSNESDSENPKMSTTKSACIDLFFDVMRGSRDYVIHEHLRKAWSQDAQLTLKIIFQIRDICKGKDAVTEFHYCLLWLFKNHPKTLKDNVQYIPLHGNWKDLCWLIKFILDDVVSFNLRRAPKFKIPTNTEVDFLTADIADLVERRITGQEGAQQPWNTFYEALPDEEAKQRADEKAAAVMREFILRKSQLAKQNKKIAHTEAMNKVGEKRKQNPHFASVYDEVVRLFASALKADKTSLEQTGHLTTTALAAKWTPTTKCAIDECTNLRKNIANSLYPRDQQSKLDETDEAYNVRISNAFQKEYLDPLRAAIQATEVKKIISESLLPHEIVAELRPKNVKSWEKHNGRTSTSDEYSSTEMLPQEPFTVEDSSDDSSTNESVDDASTSSDEPSEEVETPEEQKPIDPDQDLELQWMSYVDKLKKVDTMNSTLAICNVSDSMEGTPLEVAIAWSILCAELSTSPFNNVICPFSERPLLVKINQPTLRKKVETSVKMRWGFNTDLKIVFDLLLNLAAETELPADQMIERLYVFADMEFDACGGFKYEKDFQSIKDKFQEAGYSMPQVVFWNLKGNNRLKPVIKDEVGVALISGFSGQMMRTFLEKGIISAPYEMTLATLSDHYDHLVVVD